MPSRVPDYDPLTLASQPRKDETENERIQREREEAHARKVSLDIDEQIKQDRAALRKRQNSVKVLMLGQSESGTLSVLLITLLLTCPAGKSTTIKSRRC